LIIAALFTIGLCMGAVTQTDLARQVFGILPVANGGTNLASGTSGGILGYTGSGILASSAALGSNNIVIGGGVGAVPTSKSWTDMDSSQYVAGAGTATAMTATLANPATALTPGLEVNFLPLVNNSGAAPTLAVNGLTAKPITKLGTTALIANDLTTLAIASVIYDGTEWQLQDPQTAPTATAPNDFQEVPTGLINGSNVTYTLAHTPSAATNVNCFLNGLQQRQGAGLDYTISSGTLTYLTAPPTGYTLNCLYF
jgi:hypothetical protein